MIFKVVLYLFLHILTNLQEESAKQFLQEGIPNKPLMITSFLGNIFTYIYPILFTIYFSTWYWGIGLYITGLIFGVIFTAIIKKNIGIIQIAIVNRASIVLIPIIILSLIYIIIMNE